MAIHKEHINKVFSQKYSLRDKKKLDEYFESPTQSDEVKEILSEQWENFQPQEQTTRLDHVFYKLFHSINNQNVTYAKKQRLRSGIYQIAAILVVGIIIAASIYFVGTNNSIHQNQPIEFFSHTGFRNQFTLPDGTTGWLGYGSKLEYTVAKDNTRTVKLDGMAFFDVIHRDDQPFIVKTPTQLDVQVLGTRFNVSSYAEDNTCEVILEEGKVQLNYNNEKVEEMRPDERIIFDSKNKTIDKTTVNVSDFLSWKEGQLVLNNVDLEEACIKLSRFYNVDIELASKDLNTQKVRLMLEDETLEEALNLLSMIFEVDYTINERSIQANNSYTKRNIIISKK